jgi:PAS domain S-box-containing protein
MHKLLERQIRKCRSEDGALDLERLLELVSDAYGSCDSERRLRNRTLDVLQSELSDINKRIVEEAMERFNAVIDNVGEGIVIIDPEGNIEQFNHAAERIFGYTLDEVMGEKVDILMRTEEAVMHHAAIKTYLDGGLAQVIGATRELVAKRKNGDIFPVELTVGELREQGKLRFLGTIRDISLQKRIEQELRQSEGRFRDLAGSASDWFWETDTEYRLNFVSDRIGGILGIKPTAVLGHSYFDLGLEDDDPELARQHRSDIENRLPFRDLVFHVGPDVGKDSKTVRISGLPVFDEQGNFRGYRGLGADITREAEAERRARDAQQQLADAMESITDGIAVFGADDRLLTCNGEFSRFYASRKKLIEPGISFEQMLLSGAYEQIVDHESLKYEDWLVARLKHHREATGEPFITKTRNGLWFLNRSYRISNGGTVSIRSDITHLKLREQELDALRRQYQLILDAADEGIVGLDRQGKVTFANRVACQMLGVKQDELVGHCFLPRVQPLLFEPSDCLPLDSLISRTFSDGVTHKSEDELFWRSDETNFHAEYIAAPILEGGSVSGVVIVFRDVTLKLAFERALTDHQHLLEQQVADRTAKLIQEVEERTRTEAALRDSQARLKNIADSLFECILVVDSTGHVVFANLSAKRLLAQNGPQDELEGHYLDEILYLTRNGENIPFAKSPLEEVIKTAVTKRDDDAVFVTPLGASITVSYACSALIEANNRRLAILSFRDIADLKHAQREALHASRLASVGELAAGIAHEINTPIQYIGDNLRFIGDSIHDFTQALEAAKKLTLLVSMKPDFSAQAIEFQAVADKVDLEYLLTETPVAVRQSLDGVAQVGRIVLSMKEFSHPGTGTKTMTDINRALENTLVVSRNTWKHVAELIFQPDPELPQVACFPGEMNQVFLNIVVNAAHAIEGSGKKLPGKLTVTTAKLDDAFVEIRIADTGTGVPESIRDKIFDPFFTTKGVGKGTGQGLAISRDVVVTKHGGQLLLEGKEGEGAIFIIRLPINEPSMAIV